MLARLTARQDRMEESVHWYRVLGRDFGKVVIRDGKTGSDFLEGLAADKRFLPFMNDPRAK